MNRPIPKGAFLIFGIAFIAAGIAWASYGLYLMHIVYQTNAWPRAMGEVVSSQLGVTNYKQTQRHTPGSTYFPDIKYAYPVSGIVYKGSKVVFNYIESSEPDDAQRVLNRYPRGMHVSVSYNPDAPQDAVLEPGIHAWDFFYPTAGSVLSIVGCAMVRYSAVLAILTTGLTGKENPNGWRARRKLATRNLPPQT